MLDTRFDIHAREDLFLAPAVKIEPLVMRWYAWPHLIAPAQHAMNLAFRHMALMTSFVLSPSGHIASAQDPELTGGPFVALGAADVPAVKQLLQQTGATCADRLELAKGIKAAQKLLEDSARGFSLNELYARLPERLRGLMEIAYDISHRPSFRLLEELLYEQFNTRPLQEIRLCRTPESRRPFFMSTPRIDSDSHCSLRIPFADPRLDALFQTRTTAGNLASLASTLELPPEQATSLAGFFTPDPPPARAPHYTGTDVRVRYFGHACVLLQTSRTSILIDPMFSFETGHDDDRLTFNDLPETLDYVVLSHNHQDHCSPEMLLQLRHKVRTIVVPRNNAGTLADPSMKLILRELGYTNIQVMEPFETLKFEEGSLTSLPFVGEHADLDIASKQSILVCLKNRSALFLVDSDGWATEVYNRVAKKIERTVDAVFLGMECHGAPLSWLYGPLLYKTLSRKDDESRRLSGADSRRALQFMDCFTAPRVYIYAMGQEPWLRYIMGLEYKPDSIQLTETAKFTQACRERGIRAERLHIRAEFLL